MKNILDIFGKLNSDKRYTADTGKKYIIELYKNHGDGSSLGPEYIFKFSNHDVLTGKGNLAEKNKNRAGNQELNKKKKLNKRQELENKHESNMNCNSIKASIKSESCPKVWSGSWTQLMSGVPEVHDFHWQFKDDTKWTGNGWDKKGNFTLKEMTGGENRRFKLQYTSGIIKCKLMEYRVTEGDLTKAEGTIKYKDCKYDNGQQLVGDSGTWKAYLEKDIKNGEAKEEDTDSREYVYTDDH